MKNQLGNIKNIIVLCMALLLGQVVNAQVGSDNGIHVSGGSSSQSKVSSNIGNSTTATGYNSFASGYGSEASGHTSTALGREARALGNYSGAFGNFVKASGENSFVLGKGFTSALPLTNSVAGIMMGVNSQQPTLTISAASSANYTGKVGIGTETPSCKLEVAGSAKTTSLQTETLNVTGDVSFGNLAGNTTKIVTVGTDGKLNAKSGRVYALCD